MTTNTRNAVILTGCVVVLCVILICIRFLPDKSSEENLKTDSQSINILNESIDNIDSVEIVNNYGEYKFIKNKDNKLQIDGLDTYRRDDNMYDELSDKVCNFIADKVVSSEVGHLEIYGLNSPEAKVKIQYNDNLKVEFLIGNKAPGEVGYYMMQKDKQSIYLVSNEVISPFLKSKMDYISLSVTVPNSEDIAMKDLEYIELLKGNRPEMIKIVKKNSKDKDKQIYNIIEPVNKKVSDECVDIINSIENIFSQRIECINLTKEDIDNYGLNNPYSVLNLKYKNKDVITILLSNIPESEDFFVMIQGSDIIYRVSKLNLEWADISADKLVNSKVDEKK